ncbi:hypothetical protein [Algoriphagus sediminis]|uniref:Uncharacterized protein n=1 Tax=Algoriphagus sediminis TaxID=3057113 RepID=A0ABT7Y9Z4_9BACT|nr:hypothetical protein [Algoriphagus sediminis]MDN3203250.1 hypothetical protein [Algoriphagus sediminis]
MKFYYLSTVPNSESKYEVHERNCVYKPEMIDLVYLGPFNSGQEALRKARLRNKLAVTCSSCCTSTFRPSFTVKQVGQKNCQAE